jgi:hypothetical protein
MFPWALAKVGAPAAIAPARRAGIAKFHLSFMDLPSSKTAATRRVPDQGAECEPS